jgi:hypothetical protein
MTKILPFLVLIMLSACTAVETAEADPADDYLSHLEQLTGQFPANPASNDNFAFPAHASRNLPVGDNRIGFVTFLTLDDPQLQQLIAERNSALGKVMTPLRQLHYEHRFSVIAGRLLDLPGASTLDAEVAIAVEQKRNGLSRHYWNTIPASEAFALFFARSDRVFTDSDETIAQFNNVLNALPQLAGLKDSLGRSDYNFSAMRMEQQLDFIKSARRIGYRYIASLQKTTEVLQMVSGQLDSMVIADLKADDLQKLFDLQYRSNMQPRLVALQKIGREMFPMLEKIYAVDIRSELPETARFCNRYLSTGETSLWSEFQAAVAAHNRSWQRLIDAGVVGINR